VRYASRYDRTAHADAGTRDAPGKPLTNPSLSAPQSPVDAGPFLSLPAERVGVRGPFAADCRLVAVQVDDPGRSDEAFRSVAPVEEMWRLQMRLERSAVVVDLVEHDGG
jgi:hypothetical protein